MRYIQRCKQKWDIYKDVNKAMRCIQRCKQRQWDIYKDVNKGNERYIQRCIYKGKQNEIYTKM